MNKSPTTLNRNSDTDEKVQARELGLFREVYFWRSLIMGTDLRWPGELDERFQKNRELFPGLAHLLAPTVGDEVRILDVGAGPLTVLGNVWPSSVPTPSRPGKAPPHVTIIPIDTLADEYNKILDEAGKTPPIRCIKGEGESLATLFPDGGFDMVYSKNAIDHSADPLPILHAMLGVLKPQGIVYLGHAVNEGETQEYSGLHQWNFNESDGDFIIWNHESRTNVTSLLADRWTTTCTVQEGSWLTVTIRAK